MIAYKSTVKKSLYLVMSLLITTLLEAAVNPQPGQNLWHVNAAIGTAVDQLAATIQTDFAGTFTALNAGFACNRIPLFQSSIPGGGTLTLATSGQSYCLTQNITGNIIISGNDITLDLNSHTLVGTIQVTSPAINATIKNGNVKPAAPTGASNAAIKIDSGASDAQIVHCYVICANTTTLGVAGRAGIDNAGLNTKITNCFVQSGAGATGIATAGTGGNGGNGITTTSNNLLIAESQIISGNGGTGGTGTSGGQGGDGGVGISNTGSNILISLSAITSGNGGSGGAAAALFGGNGGAAGTGITNNSASNVQIIECSIVTGNGGIGTFSPGIFGLQGGFGGNGGDGISITGSVLDTLIIQCTIATGNGAIGGAAGLGSVGGDGGFGGDGIIDAGTNTKILKCTFTTGDGGIGNASGAEDRGGFGGLGGTAVSASGTNAQVLESTIKTGNGGDALGGAGGVTANGGSGGIGVFVQSTSQNAKMRNIYVNGTGNGGNAAAPSANGSGGDAIQIQSGSLNTQVNDCIIADTGVEGTGGVAASSGIAINDQTPGPNTTVIYSNFSYSITGTPQYVLSTGAAIDSPNGTAYAPCTDRLSNVYAPSTGSGTGSCTSTVESLIDQCCFTLNSKVDMLSTASAFNDCCFTLNSKVDQIVSGINTLGSAIDVLSALVATDFAGTFTAIDAVDRDVLTVSSKVDVVQASVVACCFTLNSKIDDLANTFTGITCSHTPLTIPSEGTTITTAGVYCLTNDATLSPGSSVAIDSDNVVLDLNGYTIFGGTGIQSSSNKITIKNGTIRDVDPGSNGISVSASDFVTLTDLDILNTTIAIMALGATAMTIQRVTMESSTTGMDLIGCSEVIVQDSINNLGSVGFNVRSEPLGGLGGLAITFQNCSCTCDVGFLFQNVIGCSIIGCKATQCITGFMVEDTGFSTSSFFPSLNFVQCISQSNDIGFSIDSVAGDGGTCLFSQCSALGNRADGFLISHQNCEFTQCSANNNGVNGFELTAVSGIANDCLLTNCSALKNTTDGFVITTTAVTITECKSDSNGVSGFNLSNAGDSCYIEQSVATKNVAIGFFGNPSTNPVFAFNRATGNVINYSISSPPSAPDKTFTDLARLYGDNLKDV